MQMKGITEDFSSGKGKVTAQGGICVHANWERNPNWTLCSFIHFSSFK